MWNLVLRIAGSSLGLWLANEFVAGARVNGNWKTYLLIGAVLGVINFFIKPILDTLALPLKILTLGLFSLIINMVLVWLVDIAFVELVIIGLAPLFWTTALVWLANFILQKWLPAK
ncbi:phage holin family protein [Candidatus Parcubacteria bacterium]|nr:phage holin family protein [Patescibacteria group bacterium]MCG2688591.1 phage holin family protein [Candidatus Parcubacteria bacterium]